MRLDLVLALLLGALPARAEPVVSPDAFEALAEGRTLHFTLDGAPFGSERFFPGRRSLWRFADGLCQSGTWRAEGEVLCFAYEGEADPSCWRFLEAGGGHVAALVEDGAETGFRIELDRIDEEFPSCPGPDVGS